MSEPHEEAVLRDSGGELSYEERRVILRARARALARAGADADAAATVAVLAFRLAQERYAVEISLVREVSPLTELTPIPCTPAFISGIVSVRGQILTVIDLRRLLGLPEEGSSNLKRVVIVRHREQEFGILTDEIVGITEITASALAPALAAAATLGGEHVWGVLGDGLILLDLRALLDDERLVVDEQVE